MDGLSQYDAYHQIGGSTESITWLASYPRSGTTLLRIILSSCFGQRSFSLYPYTDFSDPAIQHVIGHEPAGTHLKHILDKPGRPPKQLFVKTHELPRQDGRPVIYIIRDGRSAVVSYYHFLRNILHRNVSLADVILGKPGFSWSDHVNAWGMQQQRDKLVVRYEDLLKGSFSTLHQISQFIDRPFFREYAVSFERLHAQNPMFFRHGSDQANIAELDESLIGLFNRHHGETLRQVGYDALTNGHHVKQSTNAYGAVTALNLQANRVTRQKDC